VIFLRVSCIVLLSFLLVAPPCLCQFLAAFGLDSHDHEGNASLAEVCIVSPGHHGGEPPCHCDDHDETPAVIAAGSDHRVTSLAFVAVRLFRSNPVAPVERRAARPARGPPSSMPPRFAPEVSGVFLL